MPVFCKHWQINALEIEPLGDTWRDFTLKDSAHVVMFYIKQFDFIFKASVESIANVFKASVFILLVYRTF